MGVLHFRHPGTECFIHCIFECPTSRGDGSHRGAEKFHAEHIELLTLRVDFTHEDRAFQAEKCCSGC